MPTTYENYSWGILGTNNDGQDKEKCIIVSMDSFIGAELPDSTSDIDLCKSLCGDCGCDYIEKVFPNDYTYLYVEKKIDTDSFQFEIRKKDGTGQIITDSSLGEYSENEYWYADWALIRDLYGGGKFNIILTSNVLGVEKEQISHTFQVTQYDICIAQDQVKFKWYQSGSILDGRVFEGERVYESRLPGYMKEESPDFEDSPYETNNYALKSRQKKISRKYKFVSHGLEKPQIDMILENLVLGDRCDVTDYRPSSKNFGTKTLYLNDIPSFDDIDSSPIYVLELEFIEYEQILVKRPC